MKVIIADSNQLIRLGLKATLSTLNEVESVVEVSTGLALKEHAQTEGNVVVLIDYTADGFDIHDVSASLRLNPTLRFIGLTYLQSAQIGRAHV